MTIREAQLLLKEKLAADYEPREAQQINAMLMEALTGMSKVDRLMYRQEELSTTQTATFEDYLLKIRIHTPVQYIIGEAWFCGLRFHVNAAVLVPRPETAELVHWVVQTLREQQSQKANRVLDVGTGSGCIPISIKHHHPAAVIDACEISTEAIRLANANSGTLNCPVNFIQLDYLDSNARDQLPHYEIVVSNPPYIPVSEQKMMDAHVIRHEPHLALFVPDNDPLIFYRALADFAVAHLVQDGSLFLEVHEQRAESVAALFTENFFEKAEIRTDLQGKQRMIRTIRK